MSPNRVTMQEKCDRNTFIKSPLVPPSKLARLCVLLTGSDEPWKRVAAHIKRRTGDGLRFSYTDIMQFSSQRKPAECMLHSWSTDRPSVGTLYDTLREVGLYNVATFVKTEILGEEDDGDTGTVTLVHPIITIPSHTGKQLEGPQGGAQSTSDNKISSDEVGSDVSVFPYDSLAQWTQHFNERPVYHGGRLIGSGGFGKVYLGITAGWPHMAVKKLTDYREGRGFKQFAAEISTLANYCHENLVRLLGYSEQGSTHCLVYEYQAGGSVEERLACKHNQPPLTASQRVVIAQGAARGICHLHNHRHPPVIHRDIKTANILLDESLEPKVGDFGLARLGPQDPTKSNTITQELIGTKVYMAPEYAQRGQVSVKTDAYSYGVVLLELLTGLPSYDDTRDDDQQDLITRVESLQEADLDLIDKKAGPWDESIAQSILDLAWSDTGLGKCFLQADKRNRLTITEMLPTIESWTH